MKVTITNDIFYITDSLKYFSWCSEDTQTKKGLYFPLNLVTQRYFIRDILPIINAGFCDIDQYVLDRILNFVQNPENKDVNLNFLSPEGIKLEPHQVKAVELMLRYNKFGLFLGTGTGKTLIAITWLLNVRPKSCLVITPQKVIGQYTKELDKYIPGNNYVVTNYEQLQHYIANDYEAVIVDESHRAKSFTTQTSNNLRAITIRSKYVYLFSGTPQDSSRSEVIQQLAILDSRVMPVKTRVLNRYFEIDDYYQPSTEISEFSEELTEIINCYSWGLETKDAIELTKKHNYIIYCKHPSKYYDDLLKNRFLILDKTWECVADTPAKLRIYLREISNGFLNTTMNVDEEMYAKRFNFLCAKDNALTDLVNKIPKAIIYFEFTSSINNISHVLKVLNKTFVVIDGKTNKKKATVYAEQFKNGEADYLVIQCKSGNAGLDFVNCNNVIFYALPESYIVYTQCKGRIRRFGQTNECYYYHIIGENTVEDEILHSLRLKKSFTDKLFKQYLEDNYGRKRSNKTNHRN